MNRLETLKTAADLTMGDRNKQYGEPTDQMELTWDMFSLYLAKAQENAVLRDADHTMGGHHAAVFLMMNKISRMAMGAPKEDNYVDAAAYIAIAGECLETPSEAE